MQNKKEKKFFPLAFFVGIFFAVGFFSIYETSSALAANCICSPGSSIPFKYNTSAEYTAGDGEACRKKCMDVANAKYFSFSNVGKIGYRRIFNCLCVTGSLIPFKYPVDSKAYVDSDDECNQTCANQGTEYYSYSDVANLGATKVTKSAETKEDTTKKTDDDASTAADGSITGTATGGGIVTCGRSGGTMCTLCDLIKGISNIVKYLRNIAIGIAVLALTIGGVMYVVSAGEPGMIEMAKTTMKNAGIGLVIVLAAYLIISTTILYIGTKSDLGIGASWYSFTFDCGTTSAKDTDTKDTDKKNTDILEISTAEWK